MCKHFCPTGCCTLVRQMSGFHHLTTQHLWNDVNVTQTVTNNRTVQFCVIIQCPWNGHQKSVRTSPRDHSLEFISIDKPIAIGQHRLFKVDHRLNDTDFDSIQEQHYGVVVWFLAFGRGHIRIVKPACLKGLLLGLCQQSKRSVTARAVIGRRSREFAALHFNLELFTHRNFGGNTSNAILGGFTNIAWVALEA